MNDEELLKLNKLGLIPAPQESLEDFSARAEYCLRLKQDLSPELKESLAAEEGDTAQILAPANLHLAKMYDVAPSWIPVLFSNHKLTPWHGGCAWIFQKEEHSPTAAIIQLRRNFHQHDRYMGIYRREELLAHELSHVGRMSFEEPEFEEILAYQTSTSPFRRWFGPIVKSSLESVLFVLLLFIILVFDIFLVAMHRSDAFHIALWLKAIPAGLILYGLLRLWQRHRQLHACQKNLENLLKDRSKAQAVTYRLIDKEIKAFGKMTKDEIADYIHEQTCKELRWQVITKAYFD